MRESLASKLSSTLRWWVLRIAERYSAYQEGADTPQLEVHEDRADRIAPRRHFWVYVATIGELNLAERLLHQLTQQIADVQLVLISDRALYLETYRRKFPNAAVVITDGRTSHVRTLLTRLPPAMLIIVEIPVWSADAPCRLRYPLPALVARNDIPIVLLNAWSYGYRPASRLEFIERALFRRDYLRSMRAITAQTEAVRQTLVAQGARPDRVSVTGNMKFDGLALAGPERPNPENDPLFASLVVSERPCIVAGCIAEFDEQEIVIAAFARLREALPSIRLVIAPRHPENLERMAHLDELMQANGMRPVARSTHADNALPDDCDCLVLDTFGELQRFYAAGHVAFVGRNHNVLEPLSYGVPVTVLSGWESSFPSYPVFSVLRERGVLLEADCADSLVKLWRWSFAAPERRDHARAALLERLEPFLGATASNVEKVLEVLALTGPNLLRPAS